MEIAWLDQVDEKDTAVVGGKAARLGILRQAGLPVPEGFCIQNRGVDWNDILAAYRSLASQGELVVVRSSGAQEDSPDTSFAGQYETILNVENAEELRHALHTCWSSAENNRARAYRNRHGVQAGHLAILVQRQVLAKASGVLFTQDPVTGSREHMLVEAACGLGDELVAGRAAPARYVLDAGGCTPIEANGPLLSAADCSRLAALGKQVEQILGPGQDIEWALAENGELCLLQARPITPSAHRLPLNQVWTRANVGEILPNAVTPLTWSVFRTVLTGLNGGEGSAAQQALRRIHGRVYIRLDAMLDTFSYLPGVTPGVLQQALGVEIPPSAQDYTAPGGLLVRLAQSLFFLDLSGLLPRLDWLAGRLDPLPPAGERQAPALVDWNRRCFQLHLKATGYAIGAYHWLARWSSGRLPAEQLHAVLLAQEGLQTSAQGLTLVELAAELRRHPELAGWVRHAPDWPALQAGASKYPGGDRFLASFATFLEQNGARSTDEFELSAPRWAEDPAFLLSVLRKHLDAPELLDRRSREEQFRRRLKALREGLPPLQRFVFDRLLSAYRRYVRLREDLKYRLIEGFQRLRLSFLDTGARWAAAGKLERPEDIFYLAWDEIRTGTTRSLHELVAERKRRLAELQAEHAPRLILDAGALNRSDLDPELRGIASSPGVATGRARVLFDLADVEALQPGEILVAPHTDPGWTPLFLSCSAVVTEIGGFLSHGATVAREYGIPCVVNVPAATTRIHTGDRIRVDGSSGQVILLHQ